MQNFFFAALSDSNLNLSSPSWYAYSDLCNFFTPLLIYSRGSPGCVSNPQLSLNSVADFIWGFVAMMTLVHR